MMLLGYLVGINLALWALRAALRRRRRRAGFSSDWRASVLRSEGRTGVDGPSGVWPITRSR